MACGRPSVRSTASDRPAPTAPRGSLPARAGGRRDRRRLPTGAACFRHADARVARARAPLPDRGGAAPRSRRRGPRSPCVPHAARRRRGAAPRAAARSSSRCSKSFTLPPHSSRSVHLVEHVGCMERDHDRVLQQDVRHVGAVLAPADAAIWTASWNARGGRDRQIDRLQRLGMPRWFQVNSRQRRTGAG